MRARRAAGALRPHPPLQDRLRRRAAQAHARSAGCCRSSARTRDVAGAEACPPGARQRAARDRRAHRCCSSRPTSASTSLCDGRGQPSASRDALRRGRAPTPATRPAAEIAARRARPPALRRRPRRHDDPAGGRPQRARRELHEGLLRRPGDRRAPATTAASRTATCAACACPRRCSRARRCALGEREVGRVGSVVVSPALGPIALALVRREAEPGATARGRRRRATAEVVELPFRR